MKTNNKNIIIIIAIILAAAVILSVSGYFVYKCIKDARANRKDENNVTLLEVYIIKELDSAELENITKIVENIVGKDKIIEIAKGDYPLPNAYSLEDENGEKVYLGDKVNIAVRIIDDEKQNALLNAVAKVYGLLRPDSGWEIGDIMKIQDLYWSNVK